MPRRDHRRADTPGHKVAAGMGEIQAVRGDEIIAEGWFELVLMGSRWKMPPPALFNRTIVTGTSQRPDRQQAIHVVIERDVAHDGCQGAMPLIAPRRCPTQYETLPSMPDAPRLAKGEDRIRSP